MKLISISNVSLPKEAIDMTTPEHPVVCVSFYRKLGEHKRTV